MLPLYLHCILIDILFITTTNGILSHLGTIKLIDRLSEDYDTPVIEWCDGLSDYFNVSSIKFVHVL